MSSAGSRVVRTAINNDGTSVIQSDQVLSPFFPFGPGGSSFVAFDARATVPVTNREQPQDLGHSLPRCPSDGVNFSVVTFAPQSGAPMHRTLSLDYAIILSGEIVLELDGGEERTVKEGEFIVQGGVSHAWHNRTDKPCRIAFVMVGAQKVKLGDGRELDDIKPAPPG
ncbi:hypothetical protein F5Y15DRAFT_382681 [Xylariaceae sp. FL0016]|nr:hypothetical protein F5Y15DRAFT_382681 [Xylariaceae sp. FL0016]